MRLAWLLCSFFAFSAFAESQCVNCHQSQVEDWQTSHHFHAMAKATPTTVLGNFNEQTLDYQGQQARFYQQDQQLFISMPNLDGKLTDYPVLYTFGYEPLQQYMFDMGQGHIQLFPFAWDSRSKTKAVSAGLYCILSRKNTTYFIGRKKAKTGITCVPIAIQRISKSNLTLKRIALIRVIQALT